MLDTLVAHYGLRKLIVLDQDGTRTVSLKGIKAIQELIGISPTHWPTGFDPALETATGKFAKRLNSWCMDWEITVDKKTLAEIGRLAESHANPAERVYLDLTDGIMDWQPGSFRDNRRDGELGQGTTVSCFRQGHCYAVPHLKQLGALTMRLFRPGGKPNGRNFYGRLNGAGRVFLIPHDNVVVVANYYGLGGDGTKWAAIISQLFNQAGIHTTYYLAGKTSGVGDEMGGIYINGSGTYIVSEPDEPRYDIRDLDWGVEVEHESHACKCCSKYFASPEMGGNKYYCPDCGDKCERCGSEHVYSLLTWISTTDTAGYWLCERCTKKADVQTWPCGRVTDNGNECWCEECSR